MSLFVTLNMVVSRHSNSVIEYLISEGQSNRISNSEINVKLKFIGVFLCHGEHPRRKINSPKFKFTPERKKIRPMSTANIQYLTLLPPLHYPIKLCSKSAPMPQPIPALCYFIKNFPICCHNHQFVKLCYKQNT